MKKWTSIRVTVDVLERLHRIADAYKLTLNEALRQLLDLHVVSFKPHTDERRPQLEPQPVESPVTESVTMDMPPAETPPMRELTADELFEMWMRAVTETLVTIVTIYPDLRHECAMIVDKAVRAAQALGIWETETETVQAASE